MRRDLNMRTIMASSRLNCSMHCVQWKWNAFVLSPP